MTKPKPKPKPTVGPYDLIRHAHGLISNPEHWTQETLARDAKGMPVEPADKDATCFCTLGALARASYDLGADPHIRLQAKRILAHQAQTHLGAITVSPVIHINDDRDHAAVMEMFRHALDVVPDA